MSLRLLELKSSLLNNHLPEERDSAQWSRGQLALRRMAHRRRRDNKRRRIVYTRPPRVTPLTTAESFPEKGRE